MHVARNEKIDAAVAIVIGPSCARAEAAARHSSFFGHIFKFAVAQIVIERVAAESGHVNILQAVVVVVSNGHAHAPTLARESGGFGDVGEFQVVTVESAS